MVRVCFVCTRVLNATSRGAATTPMRTACPEAV